MMQWRMTSSGDPEISHDAKPGVGDIVRGAVGVAKAALGVQVAPVNAVIDRWSICSSCDQHDCGRCKACGCFTGAKVRVAGESCPQGKWTAVGVTKSAHRECCGRRGNSDNPSADL